MFIWYFCALITIIVLPIVYAILYFTFLLPRKNAERLALLTMLADHPNRINYFIGHNHSLISSKTIDKLVISYLLINNDESSIKDFYKEYIELLSKTSINNILLKLEELKAQKEIDQDDDLKIRIDNLEKEPENSKDDLKTTTEKLVKIKDRIEELELKNFNFGREIIKRERTK